MGLLVDWQSSHSKDRFLYSFQMTCGYSWGWCRVSWARWYVATVWIFGEFSGSGRSGLLWQCSQGSIASSKGSLEETGRKEESPSDRSRSGRSQEIQARIELLIRFAKLNWNTYLVGGYHKPDEVFQSEPYNKYCLRCTEEITLIVLPINLILKRI